MGRSTPAGYTVAGWTDCNGEGGNCGEPSRSCLAQAYEQEALGGALHAYLDIMYAPRTEIPLFEWDGLRYRMPADQGGSGAISGVCYTDDDGKMYETNSTLDGTSAAAASLVQSLAGSATNWEDQKAAWFDLFNNQDYIKGVTCPD